MYHNITYYIIINILIDLSGYISQECGAIARLTIDWQICYY